MGQTLFDQKSVRGAIIQKKSFFKTVSDKYIIGPTTGSPDGRRHLVECPDKQFQHLSLNYVKASARPDQQ